MTPTCHDCRWYRPPKKEINRYAKCDALPNVMTIGSRLDACSLYERKVVKIEREIEVLGLKGE